MDWVLGAFYFFGVLRFFRDERANRVKWNKDGRRTQVTGEMGRVLTAPTSENENPIPAAKNAANNGVLYRRTGDTESTVCAASDRRRA
jgi:hypothetical protein